MQKTLQKTFYHHQTAKFLATIAQNMPEMSADVMQGWIQNPKALKKILTEVLCPLEPTRSWREENGVIYFSVTSDGTIGEDWESKGFRVGGYAKQVLRSPDFKPTNGVTTEVAVLKGMLFEDNDRITKKIRAEADKRKLSKPNAELACLIREKFTDEEIRAMGLWYIVVMHEPINDPCGDPDLLGAGLSGGGNWLDACSGRPDSKFGHVYGFAFIVSSSPS